jgi:hypothetical protein
MKSLFGGTALALSLVAMLASACGGDDDGGGSSKSPGQLCKNLSAAICAQVYKCLPAAAIDPDQFGSSEPACVSMQNMEQGCDSVTADNACEGSEKYHADQASKCVDQINAASCSQLIAAGTGGDISAAAPACAMVCVVG